MKTNDINKQALIKDMKTEDLKKQTLLRLKEVLKSKRRTKAKRENSNAGNREPNETTVEAIVEARSGKFAGTVDTCSMKAFIKSCEE
jgi:hypothetical protein